VVLRKLCCLQMSLLLVFFVCGILLQYTEAATQVACVGDSITVAGYPQVLQGMLGATYNVSNFGVSGTTMLKNGDNPYWNTPAYKSALSSKADHVIIMLGTNDAKPYNWVHAANYSVDYRTMINVFKNLTSKPKIWINTPPPAYKDMVYSISQHNVNDVIVPEDHTIAQDNNVKLIDVFTATGGAQLLDPEWFYDGIHPNADGNQHIAMAVHTALTMM